MNREELVKQLDLLKLILSGEAGKEKLAKDENLFYGIWLNLFLRYTRRRKTISKEDLKLFFDIHPNFEKSFRQAYDYDYQKSLEEKTDNTSEELQETSDEQFEFQCEIKEIHIDRRKITVK